MKEPVGQLEEWEWIERYWSNQLSGEEKRFFEHAMQHDERLAQEANVLQFGVRLVNEARVETNARQTIRQLSQITRRQRIVRIRLVASAGAVLVTCLGFILYLTYSPVALPAGSSDVAVLRDFREQYQATPSNQLSVRQKQVFDLFFEGQVYLTDGQFQQAARRFERVLTYSEIRPYFREAAEWHLIVSYLQVGDVDKARALYPQLNQTNDYDIERVEKWKVWWHLQRLKWFD